VTPWRVALAALLAAAVGALAAPAAGSAATIVRGDPADRAALATAPAEIDLVGSAPPDADASHVSVRDPAGAFVSGDAVPKANGDVLRLPVAITDTGTFTVAYHVLFTDGTDTVGVLRFSVGTGVAPSMPSAAQQRADLADATAGHGHGVDPLSGALLLADVGVLFGAVLLLISRPGPLARSRARVRADGRSVPRHRGEPAVVEPRREPDAPVEDHEDAAGDQRGPGDRGDQAGPGGQSPAVAPGERGQQ
jgi:methionine-rich copper-binding protein CopC